MIKHATNFINKNNSDVSGMATINETYFKQDFYRKLVEDSMDGHLLLSTDTGQILYMSGRSKKLLGFPGETPTGIKIWNIIAPSEHSLFRERINARMEGKTLIPDRRIYTIIRKDQSAFRAEILTSKLIIDGYAVVHSILKYISSIKGSMVLLSQSVCRLNDFAEGGKPDPQILDLNDFIKSLLPTIRMKIHPDIRISSCISDEKLKINVDCDQIQLAVLSIIANSEEAIEENGNIRISTSKEKLSKEDCIADPLMIPGTYACIQVEDNGAGMDKRVMNKIGEPFFTTKFQGRGLGLASVYGIVKRQKGMLSIISKPGIGTIVRIYIKTAI